MLSSPDGQLCYQLDLKRKVGEGKDNGILLLLDTNTERSTRRSTSRTYFNAELFKGMKAVKLYIHTLSRYVDYGPGMYEMTDIKSIVGSEGFLALPDSQKQCQVQDFEECQKFEFVTAGEERCHCVPYGFNATSDTKVMWCIM